MFRSILVLLLCLSGFTTFPASAQQASLTDLPADLFDDGKSLFSMENGWWLLGGASLTLLAHEIENPDGARRALDQGAIDAVVDFGNLYGSIEVQTPLILGCWALGSMQDNDEMAGLGYDLTRSLLLTTAITGTAKHIFQRTRPNGEALSFPSGHTATAFSTAGVLSRRYGGWVGGVGIGLGVLTALGRMEDEKHFASDVIAGATIGWIIGRTVGREDTSMETAWQLVPMGSGLAMVRGF